MKKFTIINNDRFDISIYLVQTLEDFEEAIDKLVGYGQPDAFELGSGYMMAEWRSSIRIVYRKDGIFRLSDIG